MDSNSQPPGQAPNITSGQKRPRDYGEVLKGLTPTPERELGLDDSPSSKKMKIDHGDHDDVDSDGLDDGEIVETSTPTDEGRVQDDVLVKSDVRDVSSNGRGSPKELPEMRSEESQEHDPNIEPAPAEEGAEPGPNARIADTSANETEPRPHTAGWNQGVKIGLRTSFGKAGAKSIQPQNTVAKVHTDHNSHVNGNETSGSDTVETSQQSGNVTFSLVSRTWKITAHRFTIINPVTTPTVTSLTFWNDWIDENLESLMSSLLEENEVPADISVKDFKRLPRCALRALVLSRHDGILENVPIVKKQRAQIVSLVETACQKITNKDVNPFLRNLRKPPKSTDSPQLAETEHDSTAPASVSHADDSGLLEDSERQHPANTEENDHSMTHDPRQEHQNLSHDEWLRRNLYFPGTEGYSLFCTHCVSIRHASEVCPQLSCQFCGSKDHSRFGCPTKRRCSKCHQFGHPVEACQEKLALAQEEMLPCAFCGSGHKENACGEVWKSFDLSGTVLKKVQAIPAFCYTCGREGHYGPECSLPTRGGKLDWKSATWSQANRDLFVDPQAPSIALAWVGLDMDSALDQPSKFNIRGKANARQTHIHYISSDDSDDEFIKAPIAKKQVPGTITINTTAVGASVPESRQARRARQAESRRRQQQREFSAPPPPPPGFSQAIGSWQPPLPSGPPPPLPSTQDHGFNPTSPHAPSAGPSRRQSQRQTGRARGHRPRRGNSTKRR